MALALGCPLCGDRSFEDTHQVLTFDMSYCGLSIQATGNLICI